MNAIELLLVISNVLFMVLLVLTRRELSAAQKNCDKAIKGWEGTINDLNRLIAKINEVFP